MVSPKENKQKCGLSNCFVIQKYKLKNCIRT